MRTSLEQQQIEKSICGVDSPLCVVETGAGAGHGGATEPIEHEHDVNAMINERSEGGG